MSGFLYLAAGYLLGLGTVGYMTLWAWIRERGARDDWPEWLTNCLIGIHLVLGLSAITFVPSFIGHRFRDPRNSTGPILFAAAVFALLCVTWSVARDWNRWFGSRRDRSAVAKD